MKNLCSKLSAVLKSCISFFILFSFVNSTEGIVIRHDRDDEDYIAFGEEFPSVGGLYSNDSISGSGVLISETGGSSRWVLTAAHISTPDVFTVNDTDYTVNEFTRHPNYGGDGTGMETGIENDIAIAELTDPVSGINGLPWHDDDDDLTSGLDVVSVGLGLSGDGQDGETGSAGTKRAAENEITGIGGKDPFSVETAFEYEFYDPDHSDVKNLEGMGVLYDSGGPVVADFGQGYTVVGIHSYVIDNDDQGRGTYGDDLGSTRVPLYDEWIAEVVPEPSSLLMLILGSLLLMKRREVK